VRQHWDDLLRVAGSLKTGWVSASLLISKLQAYPRQHHLTYLLQEYGRLVKTAFILRYLHSQPLRRRIHAQLNKGEQLHALRSWLWFGGDGVLRQKQEVAQQEVVRCLNVVTNVVVVWNTVYAQLALQGQQQAVGQPALPEHLAQLSPARFAHLNRLFEPPGPLFFPAARRRTGQWLAAPEALTVILCPVTNATPSWSRRWRFWPAWASSWRSSSRNKP